MLLGLAYNLIDRAVYPVLTPPQRTELLDQYVMWLEVAVTEMLVEQTPNRSALAKQLLAAIYEHHASFGEYAFPAPGGSLGGTLFWEVGKLIATKLGAENDPFMVTATSARPERSEAYSCRRHEASRIVDFRPTGAYDNAHSVSATEWGGNSMASSNAICRIGVFYDGSFFAYARRYYYQERDLGWLRYLPFHAFIEAFIAHKEQGYASYRVVYAAWHQGLFTSKKATPEQLRFDRNQHHDLMHAGVEPRYLPMSQTQGEKGTDVALAVDALQVGLDDKIDIAVLVTGDGDFVPLVRALNKQGVRVLGVYFEFQTKDGKKSFINERLRSVVNYAVDVNALENDKEYKQAFKSLFWKSADFEDS